MDVDLFYIVTNKSTTKGASGILNKEELREFADYMGVNKFLVLPSSVNEMLIIPYNESKDVNTCSLMVCEAYGSWIEPEKRLMDKAFVMEI